MVHKLGCSVACGIFPDQERNLCPLHWQADSYPFCHQGSPGLKVSFEERVGLGDLGGQGKGF